MKTHYYLGWFNHIFPDNLTTVLQSDITDRKSLVLISSNPSITEEAGATERYWFDQAGILFDEYHVINFHLSKKKAQSILQNASVIFLLGGNTLVQNRFLVDYELLGLIRESKAVMIGASAGAINMSAKWLCSKNLGYEVDTSSVQDGIALDDFSILSHFDLENNMAMVQKELSYLSEEIDIYASNKDCAVRVKGDKVDILGNVYLISQSKIQKLAETL